MLCYIDSLTSENFQLADRVWNRPIIRCKPLVIDYVMYALIVCLVLLTCKGPSHRTFVLVSGNQTFAFGNDFFTNYYLLAPFLKKLAPKKGLQGLFGPQVKFSGWNTVSASGQCCNIGCTCTCISTPPPPSGPEWDANPLKGFPQLYICWYTAESTMLTIWPLCLLMYMHTDINSKVSFQVIPAVLEAIKDAEYEGTYIRPVSIQLFN